MDNQREQFKKHALRVGFDIYEENGEFFNVEVKMAYELFQAVKQQATPEGFVLVEKNASKEMIKQGYEAHDGFFTLGSVRNVWDAMIEAQEPKA